MKEIIVFIALNLISMVIGRPQYFGYYNNQFYPNRPYYDTTDDGKKYFLTKIYMSFQFHN